MAANAIVYPNLRAEMSRKQLTISEMAHSVNMSRNTLGYKLSGKNKIYLDEAVLIQKKFFPEMEVLYLFEEESNKAS